MRKNFAKSVLFTLSICSSLFLFHNAGAQTVPTIKYEKNAVTAYAGDVISLVPTLTGFTSFPGCSATALPPGLNIDALTCKISGTLPLGLLPPPSLGQVFTINVNAIDAVPQTLNLSVFQNRVIFSNQAPQVYAGSLVRIVPQLVGFNATKIPQCVATNLPPGLTIDSVTCAITGVAPSMPVAGNYNVNVSTLGALSANLQIEILGNSVVYPSTSIQFISGQPINLIPELNGFDGFQPNCSATGLPPGLTINPINCAITGLAPNLPANQVYSVRVNSQQSFPVVLRIEVIAKAIIFPSTITVYSGDLLNIEPQLVGIKNVPAQCNSSGLPSGITLNPNTCVISGIAPSAGGNGQVFTLTVNSPGVPSSQIQMIVYSSAVVYPTTQPTYVTGDWIKLTPRIVGFNKGQSLNCTSSFLPQGLYLDAYTCEISGMAPVVPGLGQIFNVTINTNGVSPISLQFRIYSQNRSLKNVLPVFEGNTIVLY